jgi:hypothetical protein
MSDWTYNGEPFTDPGDAFGFIYMMTCISNEKRYIGRKLFTAAAHRQVKGKKKKYRKDSGWKDYWSSSDEVKADVSRYGKDMFTRVILYLCHSKSEMTYLENYAIFTHHALIRTDYYNQWLTARVRKSNLLKTKLPQLLFT